MLPMFQCSLATCFNVCLATCCLLPCESNSRLGDAREVVKARTRRTEFIVLFHDNITTEKLKCEIFSEIQGCCFGAILNHIMIALLCVLSGKQRKWCFPQFYAQILVPLPLSLRLTLRERTRVFHPLAIYAWISNKIPKYEVVESSYSCGKQQKGRFQIRFTPPTALLRRRLYENVICARCCCSRLLSPSACVQILRTRNHRRHTFEVALPIPKTVHNSLFFSCCCLFSQCRRAGRKFYDSIRRWWARNYTRLFRVLTFKWKR